MLRMRIPFVLIATGTCLLFAVGCGGGGDDTTRQVAEGPAAGQAEPGRPAPDFTLPRLDGGELTLSALRGKAVIVDFWDTWCGPCRRAMPHLQELSEAYAEELVVVGVALGRDGADKVRAYVADKGLTFEMVLFDQDMKLLRDFGGIQSIPTTFLIDADGNIRRKWVGAEEKAVYERAVRDVIGT